MNAELKSLLQMMDAPHAGRTGRSLIVSEAFLDTYAAPLREATERSFVRVSGFADLTGPLVELTLLPQGRAAIGLPVARPVTGWAALARLLAVKRPTFGR